MMENPNKPDELATSKIDIAGWLEESWVLYKIGWQAYVATAVLYFLAMLASSFIPYIGGILLGGPLTVGFYFVVADMARGKEYKPIRLFQGFRLFVPAFMAYFLIMLFSTVGFVMLIIPGLIISGWYLLTYIFIIDRGYDFWSAMEASRKVAMTDLVGMTIFFLAISFINVVGVLALGIGTLITLPLSHIAVFVAYKNLVGFESLMDSGSQEFADKLIDPEKEAK